MAAAAQPTSRVAATQQRSKGGASGGSNNSNLNNRAAVGGVGMINLTPVGQMTASEAASRNVSVDDIQKVQNLIEKCLQQSLTQEEAVSALESEAQIQPKFTTLVWQRLEEQNPEFFQAYYMRLKLKDQIVLFNHLLEQQMRMFQNIQTGPWLHAPQAAAGQQLIAAQRAPFPAPGQMAALAPGTYTTAVSRGPTPVSVQPATMAQLASTSTPMPTTLPLALQPMAMAATAAAAAAPAQQQQQQLAAQAAAAAAAAAAAPSAAAPSTEAATTGRAPAPQAPAVVPMAAVPAPQQQQQQQPPAAQTMTQAPGIPGPPSQFVPGVTTVSASSPATAAAATTTPSAPVGANGGAVGVGGTTVGAGVVAPSGGTTVVGEVGATGATEEVKTEEVTSLSQPSASNEFDLGGNMELPGWVVGGSVSGADGDSDFLTGFGMSDLELQGSYGDADLGLMNHDDEKQYLNDTWAV